jgi:hypothetical protein
MHNPKMKYNTLKQRCPLVPDPLYPIRSQNMLTLDSSFLWWPESAWFYSYIHRYRCERDVLSSCRKVPFFTDLCLRLWRISPSKFLWFIFLAYSSEIPLSPWCNSPKVVRGILWSSPPVVLLIPAQFHVPCIQIVFSISWLKVDLPDRQTSTANRLWMT